MAFESPVPFFQQETEWSCTPACLRMVLAHLGTVVDEAALRECCQTTETGTHADGAVACARRHGFKAEHLRRNEVNDLRRWLADDVYPIALVNMFPLLALWRMHAVVVIGIEADTVYYLDPARGQREDALVSFEQAWTMNLRRAIVMQREE